MLVVSSIMEFPNETRFIVPPRTPDKNNFTMFFWRLTRTCKTDLPKILSDELHLDGHLYRLQRCQKMQQSASTQNHSSSRFSKFCAIVQWNTFQFQHSSAQCSHLDLATPREQNNMCLALIVKVTFNHTLCLKCASNERDVFRAQMRKTSFSDNLQIDFRLSMSRSTVHELSRVDKRFSTVTNSSPFNMSL